MTRPSPGHLVRAAKHLRIQIPVLSLPVLVRHACAHYNQLNPGKRPADPRSVRADPLFMERICVNYLRHALSEYDANRDALRRLTSDPGTAQQVGAIIKGRTLAAIAETYPMLAGEARRQAVRTDQVGEGRGRR